MKLFCIRYCLKLKNWLLQAEEQAWVEDPPKKMQYLSLYAVVTEEEESASASKFEIFQLW